MSADSPELPISYAAGARIAGYRLEEQIGRGGMAVVFRAHDERLDRPVALKILMPELAADAAFRQRFIRESRAAAAVDDPHIIPVFEAGDAGGVLFIAMRLVRGGDVRSLVKQVGQLAPGRVADLVSQVASALDAAHQQGLVHRDVKPGNMLLGVIGNAGWPDHVYLADFGLSKGSLEVSGLTGTGQFLGTLDYISPEQIAGRPVDGRADQYALACTAFELLTGTPPFARQEAMAVMYAQLSEPPPPVTPYCPQLPAAVDAVFARALSKVPGQRFGTCREFADELRDALGLRPYDSGPRAFGSRARQQAPAAPPGGGPVPRTPAELPGAASPSGWSTRTPGQASWGNGAAAGPSGPTAWQGDHAGHGGGPGPGNGIGLVAGRAARSGPVPAGRQRWPAVIVVGLVVLAAAGGGVAYLTSRHQHQSPPAAAHRSPVVKTPAHRRQHQAGRPHARTLALAPPGCRSTIGPGRSLRLRPSGILSVPEPPYGAIVTADLSYTFVTLPTAIEVLRNRAGVPVGPPVRTIPVPDHPHAQAITSDGRYLITATDHGVTVIRVSTAERADQGNPVAGLLPSGLPGNPGGDDLILTPDDRFLFVAMRYADKIAVFDLGRAVRHGFSGADVVGYITAGVKPHGMALSPDGKWLYVASRFARPGTLEGLITVLRVRAAETRPARSKVSSAIAGCGAYRVITSADGNVLWVIAQQSNALVAFSAPRLRSDPRHALIASVPIGAVPLDEVLVNGGTRLLVTDNAGADLAVVSPAAALAHGKHALVGYVRTTALPRFFAFEQDGPVVLLVTGDSSGQVRALRLDWLP